MGQKKKGGGDGQSNCNPFFWLQNHANSTYFGAKSALFLLIETLGTLFLLILNLALIPFNPTLWNMWLSWC